LYPDKKIVDIPAFDETREWRGWVEKAVCSCEGVSGVEVNRTFDPPWSPDRMSEEAQVAVGWY